MPRPNPGPRLVVVRDKRWADHPAGMWIVRWTERGRKLERSTGFDAADSEAAQAWFESWLGERRRAARTGPGDPDQVYIVDALTDYANEHGGTVASPATLAGSIEPLIAFFRGDTIASLIPERVKEYWVWRRAHSVRGLDRERTSEVEIIERGAGDGTIIRELAGALRPAIRHAIEQRRLVPGSYYVPVPQAPPGRDYWITRSEAARLFGETRRDKRARLHLPLYAIIALYTGARRGAILELTWPQVDLSAGASISTHQDESKQRNGALLSRYREAFLPHSGVRKRGRAAITSSPIRATQSRASRRASTAPPSVPGSPSAPATR
ncbi:MAG: hypothetical protein ACJ8AH_19940 [Stellaceae bacterium]